jgi:putative membrane protein
MDHLIRYAHFLGILVLFAALTAAHLLTARSIDGRRARLLARIDGFYGLGALAALGSGLAMLFGLGFGKGTGFYLQNGVFHLKLTLFVLVVLLSIRPTVFFLRHRRAADAAVIEVPRAIIMLQRVQVLIVPVIPLLGVLIARGTRFGG